MSFTIYLVLVSEVDFQSLLHIYRLKRMFVTVQTSCSQFGLNQDFYLCDAFSQVAYQNY